jgi:hypothetical protein
MIPLSVEGASRELTHKSCATLHQETALTWAARAVAAYRFYRTDTARLQWLLDAEAYAHEALEHAALSGDAEILSYVSIALQSARAAVVEP